jgi:hypothetical protein
MKDIGIGMDNLNLIILGLLLILGYIVLYLGGRKYLENFEINDYNNQPRFKPNGEPNTYFGKVFDPEIQYSMSPVNDLDSYEIGNVFQNQGSKTASRKQISEAMTRYPMDWAAQGPGSQYFQDNQAEFEKNMADKVNNPPSNAMYKEIDGDMIPPDRDEMEAQERQILQTYKPESSKGLLQYSVDDVKMLVDRVFTKKGLIPVIEKSKQGENIWEITEVKEKDPHIIWEDELEQETQRQRMDKRGEEVIEVPYTASDLAAGLDPFLQARNLVRDGKYDYYDGSENLERMYQPTYITKSCA